MGLARARLVLIALAAGACQGSTTVPPYGQSVTLITVDPSAFQGSAVCGANFFYYTATLTDVNTGVPLIPSGLVPCTQPVSFSGADPTPIVSLPIGHSYTATVEGYDRSDIQLDAGIPPLDLAGNPVAPAWFSKCGFPLADASADGPEDASDASPNPFAQPVQARDQAEVFVRNCTPFATPLLSDGSVEATAPAPDASVESGPATDATPPDVSLDAPPDASLDGGLDVSPISDSAAPDSGETSPGIDDAAETSPSLDDAPQETNDAAFGTDDALPDTLVEDSMSPGQDP